LHKSSGLRTVARSLPFFFLVLILPALVLNTRTFPLVVVDGNSMNPVLTSGDVIVYRGSSQAQITNGSLVVYFSGQTGLAALDYMVRPIIVHRVVGIITQSDGTVYYRTKGDNNQFDDPALVKYDQVLGTPVDTVPIVGALVLFVKSPQGLIFLIAAATFLYLNRYENVRKTDRRKKELTAIIARMALNGELEMKQFEEFKLAIEFGEDLPIRFLKNPVHASLADWIKSGGLTDDWREEPAKCPQCLQEATMIKGKKDYFLLCPRCTDKSETPALPGIVEEPSEPFVRKSWSAGATRGVMALVLALDRLIRRKTRPRDEMGP
jgi:signal peptidase I